MAAEILPAPESDARRKAREIIDGNAGATLTTLVALAYLEGKVDGMRELRQAHADAIRPAPAPAPTRERHEFDCFCMRCGRRDGVKLSRVAPEHGFFQTVCFHCSAGDEPRSAA